MKRIVLISCVKSKQAHAAKARDLYTSPWFRLAIRYAEMLKPDLVFILSAKYGLLNLDAVIEPYERTLKTMPLHEVRAWAAGVLDQLRPCADLDQDHFVILASDKYRRFLLPCIRSFEIPMLGLSIGRQLQFMKGKRGHSFFQGQLMKKAYLTGVRRVEVREVPDPAVAAPDDVLVRLSAVGVCGSDLHYYREGRIGEQVVEFPFAVGHECAGVVEQAGPAARSPGKSKGKMPSPLLPGTRVAIDPLVACGRCDQCLAGRPHTCREQKFLGCPGQLEGATAERLLMPARCVYPIPDAMTFEQAVLAEPLAIALWAVRLAGSVAGKRVAVLGCGPIGLCVIQALRAAAADQAGLAPAGQGASAGARGLCTILATDILEPRVALAGRTGADWAGNAARLDAAAAILRQAPRGVDLVFECAGMQETIDQAGKVLTPGGRLVLLGIPAGNRLSFDMNDYRRKELCVQNVRRQNSCSREALELIAAGKVHLEEQVTHHFSLEESQAAFDLVADYKGGVVKAIIHP